jgi:hypothetical protein
MRDRLGLALCLLLTLAALVVLPAAALASGDGDGKAGDADKAPAVDPALEAATAAALADPGVAAVLDGRSAALEEATPWGGTADEPAGYRLQYRWAAALADDVGGEWPLLHSDSATPEPPYDSTLYRIRASSVTGLQVDVLLAGDQVIQVMPKDGETEFVLREQTWPPFSWFPWFTADPWVLAPVFLALLALFVVRAWLRSRAWNRRLPSMTRHDRQFIARVAVLLFLIAGFAWQFYEGWYAATGPSLDSGSSSAGSLASLPLLLIPPGLFVAGLILELSAAPRRGSWALLAVLSVAASAYFLAAALTGATTNLNLTYYILLAVLGLISIPRAFSAGKMGMEPQRGAAVRLSRRGRRPARGRLRRGHPGDSPFLAARPASGQRSISSTALPSGSSTNASLGPSPPSSTNGWRVMRPPNSSITGSTASMSSSSKAKWPKRSPPS